MSKLLAFSKRLPTVYLFAIFSSILLSIWINYQETVINADAICYLLSAEIIGSGGIKGAMQLCGQAKWPFYSFLIYALANIGHVSYQLSAYFINAGMTLISVLVFIRIIKALGGSTRTMWLGALVILLAHEFNGVREYIIRDHGFWAFYLTSILFLLHFFRQATWFYALAFSMSLIVATLFRIEGAIFLLAAPFLAWFLFQQPLRARCKYFFMLNAIPIMLVFALLAWLILHPQETLSQWSRVAEVPHQLMNGFKMIAERYAATKASLGQHVLSMESSSEAGFILILLLLVWYLVAVVYNLSFIYAMLVAYAWLRRVHPLTPVALLVLGGYLFINVAISFGFLAERLFLSKRYLIALTLVLMLWIPFALDYLISRRHYVKEALFLAIACFGIFISALGGIFEFGHSKAYIHQAGDWLAQHVKPEASLYTNDYILMYYSKHFGNRIFAVHPAYVPIDVIAKGKWKQYDYLALRLSGVASERDRAILNEIQLTPVQEFKNKRGDRIVIFMK